MNQMTTEEIAVMRAYAERARIGDEVVFSMNGNRMVGEIRWMTDREINIEIGMPRKWREVLGWAPSPAGQFTIKVSW